MKKRRALIAGATGLIGSHLLLYLLDNTEYSEVIVLVRKPLDMKHPKLTEKVVHYDNLEEDLRSITLIDDLFCCLGTTIKVAKTKENFRKVDYDYPVQLAKLAKKWGSEKFLIVSAIGANANSNVFYNKVKGEMEEVIQQIGLKQVYIFRPSLLLGKRQEIRLGEKVASLLSPLFGLVLIGPLRKYRAIKAQQVAYAMSVSAIKKCKDKVVILESDEIAKLR